MADIIVLAILGLAVFLVLRYKWKAGKNKEGCCGCGCSGTPCAHCDHNHDK